MESLQNKQYKYLIRSVNKRQAGQISDRKRAKSLDYLDDISKNNKLVIDFQNERTCKRNRLKSPKSVNNFKKNRGLEFFVVKRKNAKQKNATRTILKMQRRKNRFKSKKNR